MNTTPLPEPVPPDANLPPPAIEPGPASPWMLCVSTGVQQGARQPLLAGRTLVGNDYECDLVLGLDSELPRRALLSLIDDSLSVTSMAGELRVNSRLVEPGCTQAFSAGDVLSVGGVEMTVERQGPESGEAEGAETEEAAEDVPAPPAVKPRHGALPLLLASLATATLIGAWWSDADGSPRMAQTASPRSQPEELREVLKASGFGSLRVTAQPAGPRIEGWLPSERELSRLKALLQARRLVAALKVQTQENLAAAGRNAANGILPDTRIEADADASLRVHVNSTDIPTLRKLASRLMADLPGLARLRIFTPSSPEPALSVTRGPNDRVRSDETWVLPIERVFDDTRRIASIESQPVPSVLLADGRRIFEGGVLDARLRIERIGAEDMSVLLDDTTRVLVPLR